MTINSTSSVANRPSFGACALLGEKAQEYLARRLKAEGPEAVAEFKKYLDNLTNWGYVNINKTLDKDVYQLQGATGTYTRNFPADAPLDFLRARLDVMKTYNAIIDQA